MKNIKNFSLICLTIITCILFTACGKEPGDEFVGTWKYAKTYDAGSYTDLPIEEYYVIERLNNSKNSFVITYYKLMTDHTEPRYVFKEEIVKESIKPYSRKEQYSAQYQDGVMVKDPWKKFILDKDNKMSVITARMSGETKPEEGIFERISDKSMTFEEMNNGRDFPTPK